MPRPQIETDVVAVRGGFKAPCLPNKFARVRLLVCAKLHRLLYDNYFA